MKHISVVLFDDELKSLIEHESMPDGEIILNYAGNEGLIEILLKVNEISLEDKTYQVLSRRFLLDKFKLVLSVRQNNK
jgi:hypothetical protein